MPDMPPNHSAPSITADALKSAIDGLSAGFRERMDIEAASLLRVASSQVDALLVYAYQEGVRDGFLQGARAAQAEIQVIPAQDVREEG